MNSHRGHSLRSLSKRIVPCAIVIMWSVPFRKGSYMWSVMLLWQIIIISLDVSTTYSHYYFVYGTGDRGWSINIGADRRRSLAIVAGRFIVAGVHLRLLLRCYARSVDFGSVASRTWLASGTVHDYVAKMAWLWQIWSWFLSTWLWIGLKTNLVRSDQVSF